MNDNQDTYSQARQRLQDKIALLKKDRPDNWKRDVLHLAHKLSRLDDPFGGHEYHDTEFKGRHNLPAPHKISFDRMDDRSRP